MLVTTPSKPVSAPKKSSKWWILGGLTLLFVLWPLCFWASLLIGKYELHKNHPDRAVFWLAGACRIWPWSYDAHLEAARALRQTHQYSLAESNLNDCLKLRGGASEDVQIEFLLMRVETGETDDPSWHLMKYVDQEHPKSYEIMEALARAQMHRLKYGPAYAMLNRMITLQPDRALAYYWRGWVLERMDNAGEAKNNYIKALELDPSITAVRLRLGEILMEDNRPDEAIPFLESLYADFPDNPEINARLGQLRFLQGKWPEARPLMEKALSSMENDSPLLLHLARLDLQEGKPAEAEVWLSRILKNDPTDTEAQFSLITAYQALGKTTEAKKALEDYKEKKITLDRANKMLKDEANHPSQSADTAFEIGKLMKDIGRVGLGIYWLEQALTRDALHKPTHLLLAEYYDQNGDSKRASFHRAKAGEVQKPQPK